MLPRFVSLEVMNRSDFIKRLARKHQRSQLFYSRPLGEMLTEIQEILAEGQTIRFLGFGTFYTRTHTGKIKDFKTKKPKEYTARVAHFSPGDILKRAIRGRKHQAQKSDKPRKKKNLSFFHR